MTPAAELKGARSRTNFIVAATLALSLLSFVGFAPSFYLRDASLAPLSPVLLIHGIAFTIWLALLVVQAVLVSNELSVSHRVVGSAAAWFFPALIASAATAGIDLLQRMPADSGEIGTVAMMVFGGLAQFAGFTGAALWHRRNADVHWRCMLLGAIAAVEASAFRLTSRAFADETAFLIAVAIMSLFIVALVAYDLKTRKRIHVATGWGIAIDVVLRPVSVLVVAQIPAWIAFSQWIRS